MARRLNFHWIHFQAVGVDIVAVYLIIFVITYYVTILLLPGATSRTYNVSSMFPDLSSPINVWQMTLRLATDTSVSVIWTFVNMTLSATRPLATVAKDSKVSTDWSRWIDTDMRIATRRIGAFASNEMHTGRDSFCCRIVR